MTGKREINQLALDVCHRLVYGPDNFLLHQGVSNVFKQSLATILNDGFQLIYIEGGPRSGKTHFSIRLAEELSRCSKFPRLLEGERMVEWLGLDWSSEPNSGNEVYIIDDAHLYLSTLIPGASGSFVDFVETSRVAQNAIVLLSSYHCNDFSWDGHIRSRVDSGTQFCFGSPADEEVGSLVEIMAKQRGLRLNERKLQYLLKRLGRNISSIESYLNRLQHLSEITGSNIDLSLLCDALENQ